MEVIYGRISSKGQKSDTQLKEGVKPFIDTISGTVSFMERPEAQKLISYLQKNPNTKTIVKDISRLGRSTTDILNTIEYFNKNNYDLELTKEGIKTNTPIGKMVTTMIASVYEMELSNTKERTRQGQEIGKIKGVYKGRKKGATAKKETLLKKHFDIVNCLEGGMNISKTALTTKKNKGTVRRIKEILSGSNRQTSILDAEYKK